MDVKQFLRKIRAEQTEIELLLLKIDNITVIHAIVYDRDKVSTSNDSDLSDIAIKNAALLNAIDRKIKDLQEHQTKAFNLISGLENDAQRQILYLYYLSRKKREGKYVISAPYSFDDVAEELGYSSGYVRHLHGDALAALRKMEKALA